jgi:hypothetical protein
MTKPKELPAARGSVRSLAQEWSSLRWWRHVVALVLCSCVFEPFVGGCSSTGFPVAPVPSRSVRCPFRCQGVVEVFTAPEGASNCDGTTLDSARVVSPPPLCVPLTVPNADAAERCFRSFEPGGPDEAMPARLWLESARSPSTRECAPRVVHVPITCTRVTSELEFLEGNCV